MSGEIKIQEKPISYEKWEFLMTDQISVPTLISNLGSRISKVLDLYPDRTSAAEAAGKSTDQLIAYAKGTSRPPFETLARLASPHGISLDWLATGQGPMRRDQEEAGAPAPVTPEPAPVPQSGPPLDGHLLGLCFEGVRAVYRDVNARIDDRSAGEMAGRLYADVMAATEGDPDPEPARRAAIRMGLQQLRRELVAVPTASKAGKHSA